MVKYLTAVALAALMLLGCSTLNTEKCLQKEGFKNCEDFKGAAKKAVGNDEVLHFHDIAKKCGCQE